MSNLKLTLACGDYDRTRALRDGRANPEGIELTYIPLHPAEIFWRMLQFNEFDVSEMSLSNYMTEKCRENPRFVAIPVFPSRVFRHSGIFINKKSGIKQAEDLKGKRVGIPEYSVTAALWIRGFLQHDHGVAPSDIEWHEGGQEERGPKKQRIQVELPKNVRLKSIPWDRSLDEMLANGEIDALISPTVPPCFAQKHPDVDRLWSDYKKAEMDYFRRTKLFPIMHTVVIRKEIYEAYPWVALSLYKAFSQAKKLCQEALTFIGALSCMLPWSVAEYDSTVNLMGEEFWPYGVEANRATLETMTQYSHEQGLSNRKLSVEELFTSSTVVPFKY